ncbi:hypothetical protein GOBAR_AA36467 [Gossypium barbadense]|uniref:Leucine-rich repeat-containing N-terminal plant-type domain-containing protein n=1 Tax=Gossypium barbadense TaxID=3634 RepID=A0A2P5VZI4_GOSBA|nr:hypothetical protein GOBAR_AA36467 [Gossypium barbadense]
MGRGEEESKIPQWTQEVGNDSLTYLNVSHNSLTEVEQFPWWRGLSLICNAGDLQILDLSHNNLSGTILQFGKLSNNLEFLNLKKNKFYGTIPPTFAKGC